MLGQTWLLRKQEVVNDNVRLLLTPQQRRFQ